MKRRIAAIGAGLVLLLLAACGNTSSASQSASEGGSKHYTIGITLLSLQYPFLDTLYAAAKKQAAKDGVTLIGEDPRQSVSTELAQIQDLIAKKPNAIIMIPVDQQQSIAAAKLVNAAHIPLFLVNTKLVPRFAQDGGKFVSYIGSSDLQAGQIEGQFTAQTLGKSGNVIYLVTQFGGASTELRQQGFLQVLRSHPGIHVVSTQQAQGSRATAKNTMENLLARYKPGTVQAVVAQNDEMAIGALSAINQARRRSQFKLIMGVDAEPAVWPYIKDGQISGSIFQNAVAQGTQSIQQVVKYLSGAHVPSLDNIPFQLVTKQNLTQVIPAAGQ